MKPTREEQRKRRHQRIRKTLWGTHERPRLCVFRSNKALYAQAIDDYEGKTLFSFSTLGEKFKKQSGDQKGMEGARKLGQLYGPELLQKGIRKVVFDRAGYQYHGRIKALAEGLRKAGVAF